MRWREVAVASVMLAGILAGCTRPEGDHATNLPGLDEVLAREPWVQGEVEFEGIVANVSTGLHRESIVPLLQFEPTGRAPVGRVNVSEVAVWGVPGRTYTVGERVRMTLHFEDVVVQGRPGVVPRELASPFPKMFLDIARLSASIGQVTQVRFVPVGPQPDGAYLWRLQVTDGSTLPFDRSWIALHLSKPARDNGIGTVTAAGTVEYHGLDPNGISLDRLDAGRDFVMLAAETFVDLTNVVAHNAPSAKLGAPVDEVADLAQGRSVKGILAFRDADADGRMGDGDEVTVRPPVAPASYTVYWLASGDCARGCAAMPSMFVVGPAGVMPVPAEPERPAFRVVDAGPDPVVLEAQPVAIGESLAGLTVDVGVGAAPWPSGVDHAVPVRDGPLVTSFGDVEFQDRNGNAVLDGGDRFVVRGMRANETASLALLNDSYSSFTWIAGYGAAPSRMYNLWLDAEKGSNTALVHGRYHTALAFGSKVEATVRMGDVVVADHVRIHDGVVATWVGGQLEVLDRDNDRTLGQDDLVRVTGAVPATYEVEIEVLWGFDRQSVTLEV